MASHRIALLTNMVVSAMTLTGILERKPRDKASLTMTLGLTSTVSTAAQVGANMAGHWGGLMTRHEGSSFSSGGGWAMG